MKSFKIKAYGQEWSVKVLKAHPLLGEEHYGRFIDTDNEILINANWSEQSQKTTLLHEILELINSCSAMGLTEQQIRGLEAGLYMIIHDNKLRF